MTGQSTDRGTGQTTLQVLPGPDGTGDLLLAGTESATAGALGVDCGAGITLVVDAWDPTAIIALHLATPTDPAATVAAARLLGITDETVVGIARSREVEIPADRSPAYRAAALLARRRAEPVAFAVDPDAGAIAEASGVLRLATHGLPVDADGAQRELIGVLRHALTPPAGPATVPAAVLGNALDLLAGPLDGTPDLQALQQLFAAWVGEQVDQPDPSPSAALLDVPAEAPRQQRALAFAAGGTRRTDTLEWHLGEAIVPSGLSSAEGAIVTTLHVTWVRICVEAIRTAGAWPVDEDKAWAVVFDLHGQVIAFAPGHRGASLPGGPIGDDAWGTVLTLPPDLDLDAIYIGIRRDPTRAGESLLDRALGRSRRDAMRAALLYNRYRDDPDDHEALLRTCRYLHAAIDRLVETADRIPDARQRALDSARQCLDQLRQAHGELRRREIPVGEDLWVTTDALAVLDGVP